MTAPAGLTELDAKILALAADPPPTHGLMLNRIQDLGVGENRYYQRLNELLNTEAGLAAHPGAVNRIRRLRTQHIRRRLGRGGWAV